MPDRRPEPSTTPAGQPPPKTCQTCGRSISWRKKWERSWDEVRFCSDSCRTHQPSGQDHALEAAILSLLQQRGRDKTICPSEAARTVSAHPEDPSAWQPLMEPARAAARRLAAAGQLRITQHGHPVNPSTARGPIRLKLP